MELKDIILNLYNIPEPSLDHLKEQKRKYARENNLKDLPSNILILNTYNELVTKQEISDNNKIKNLLRKKWVRSMSGIVPIQVLTKPFRCPGECIFCPNDASMPKSYINTEPWAMRALLNEFDPYKQVYNRLLSLNITWHSTDKIEMIVLWWTWDVYPDSYKKQFIKWLYDACNSFEKFKEAVKLDYNNPKSAKFKISEDVELKYPETIEESLKLNETANHRIIWLTIETRPEYVTDKNCIFWREMWVTRIEMWIQSMFDDVLEANKRWHTIEQVRIAMHKLRQYWFKISTHFMPWLYKSTVEKDIETFKIAYTDSFIKPDEIKFYPTSVIPNTELFDLYEEWQYKPLNSDSIKKIIKEVKQNYIPPYTRIKRLIRDIPSDEIVAGSDITNLRQLCMREMTSQYKGNHELRKKQYSRLYENLTVYESVEQLVESIDISNDTYETMLFWKICNYDEIRDFVCLCTRCREIRWRSVWVDLKENLVIRKYLSSVWTELFVSIEDDYWYLYWFVRLLLVKEWNSIDIEWLWGWTALIRELHVYWQVAKISEKWTDKSQHKWYWTKLMELSEKISINKWYKKLSVIAWVWVRWYYEKLWYSLEWTYMVKYFRI